MIKNNNLFYLILILIITISKSESFSLKTKESKSHSILPDDPTPTSCEECYFYFHKEIPIFNKLIENGETTCSGVCDNLTNSTKKEKDYCLLYCDYLGWYQFQHQLFKGIPPTERCNSLHLCKENDGGATINAVIITPESAVVGTNFSIKVDYQVTGNILYTGQVNCFIMDHFTEFSQTNYFFNYLSGVYSYEFIFQTVSIKQHEFWSGKYNVLVSVESDSLTYSEKLSSLIIEASNDSSLNITGSNQWNDSHDASYF